MPIITLLLSLLACSGEPCPSYRDAFNACYETLDPGSNNRLESGYCADFDSTSDDYFTCLAEAYESGDCTSDEGISAIDAAVAECTL